MPTSVPPHLMPFARSAQDRPPRHLGTRYDRRGTFLPEPGNTVVCHLVPDAPESAAIIGVRNRMRAMPRADLLAFTPASSLHMTVFQGIIEHRRLPGYWPPDLDLDTPIPAMTAAMLGRLDGFRPCGGFRIKVDEVLPTGLTVSGYGADDAAVLKAWRDAFADVFGYRHPDHDAYRFHITFAYMLDWIPDEDLAAVADVLDGLLRELRAKAPVITLAPPAFCRFADMNHFEELKVLA